MMSTAAAVAAMLASATAPANAAAYVPSFSVTLESLPFLGSAGPYTIPIYVIRDAAAGGGIVATYSRKDSFLVQTAGAPMGEINLLAPTPALVPMALPSLDRYGWAHLFGTKVTTIPWLDCCSETGDVQQFSVTASADASTVTVVEDQRWFPDGNETGRDGQSLHTHVLSYSAASGTYALDMLCFLRIKVNGSLPQRIEFTNWLSPYLANPVPTLPVGEGEAAPWTRSSFTAWLNDTGANHEGPWRYAAFAENILAGAMLGTYAVAAAALPGGARMSRVAMVTPGGWSPSLAFFDRSAEHGAPAGQPPLNLSQQTCPTWMDQHQVVSVPQHAVDAGGYTVMAPAFTLSFLPPVVSDALAANATVLTYAGNTHRNGSSYMLRLGRVEDWDVGQPIPLTQPTRALSQLYFSPDFDVRPGVGVAGTAGLVVGGISEADWAAQPYAFASSVPLVPLPPATAFNFSAAARVAPGTPPGSVRAFLRLALYEADDFNFNIPSNRLLNLTSAAAGADWTALAAPFTTPAFPVYADIRMVVLCVGPCAAPTAGSAIFDDILFAPAAAA